MAPDDLEKEKGFSTGLVKFIIPLISAITPILVAVIAIFPQLRKEDSQKIAALEKIVNELKQTKSTGNAKIEESFSTVKIAGNVNSDSNSPLQAEVYLLHSTGNDLITTTDDDGKFEFDKVRAGSSYWIVVRDINTKQSGRGLIKAAINDPAASGKVKISGGIVKYSVNN